MKDPTVPIIDKIWSVKDKIPAESPTAIVGLALSSNHTGNCSKLVEAIVRSCAVDYCVYHRASIIFSNGSTIQGKVVAYEERDFVMQLGVPISTHEIIVPTPDRNKNITNTEGELYFALETVRSLPGENKSLLVVAEVIHMRRVVLTLRKLQREFPEIKIYWESVRAYNCYGTDTVQKRFLLPVLFLSYETLAILRS